MAIDRRIIVLSGLLLCGCGLKGGLYLPAEEPAEPPQAESVTDESEERRD